MRTIADFGSIHTLSSSLTLSEDELRALLLSLPDTTLACTHRESFEQLFGGEIQCEKGGAWILERHGAELVPTEYLAPPVLAGGTRQAVRSTA